jgi:hypothetical protein
MSLLENARARQIRKYVMCHYGNLISTEETAFDAKDKLWKAQLKANYPRLIKNDYPEEGRFIRVLPLRRLGTVYFNENLHFLRDRSITREESIRILRSYLQIWQARIENIVVAVSSLQLANTSSARVFLNPVNMILANFLQKEEVVISFVELEKLRRRAKLMRWLSLLEDLELVKKIEDGYTYGDMFTELRKEAKSDKEFKTLAMAHVLRECYPMLREVFRIRQLETLVHLDSCYYRPALEAETILYQKAESLFSRFMTDYRYRPRIELRHVLHELRDSGALLSKKSYYYANEELYREMLEITQSEIPEIAFPRT